MKVSEQLGDTEGQAQCLIRLAQLLCDNNQFEAAEEATLHTIKLFSKKSNQFELCQSHRVLGSTYRSKGELEKAIHHFEVALGITSPFDWYYQLFGAHFNLAGLFCDQDRFKDANAHIECAKSHMANSLYDLGAAMEMQASIWYKQHRLEEVRSETLCAIDVYKKVGATKVIEDCRMLLQDIEGELGALVAS